MTDKNNGDFFTKKHARLSNIAFAANIFAWIIFIVHILLIGSKYIEAHNAYYFQTFHSATQRPDFIEMLKNNPLYTTSLFIKLLGTFIHGIVFGLVLKGISLGLYMIVETNLNQKESFPDSVVTESDAVFYKPKDILRLEKWINKSTIAVIGATIASNLFLFQIIKGMFSTIFPSNELGATLFTGIVVALNILLFSALYYFLLKALSSTLKIIMEIEFNTRHGNKNA